MAITVKKRTAKTIKAKAPTQAKTVTPPGQEDAPAKAEAPKAAAVAAGGSGKIEGASPVVGMIFAILAFIMFGVLIMLQIMEWKFYEAPIGVSQRGVWPMFKPPEGTLPPGAEITDEFGEDEFAEDEFSDEEGAVEGEGGEEGDADAEGDAEPAEDDDLSL